jgi:hypothetical protein
VQLRRLKEADDVAVRVFYRGDQLAPAEVPDLLPCHRARVDKRLQVLLDVVDVPVGEKA